jgi:hypothetical protein
MLRTLARFSMAGVLLASLNISASATPRCLSDQEPYALTDDIVNWTMSIVNWTMSIAPGAECIQGLRWSYMQIEFVSVLGPPKKGKAVVVGSGFRYFADPDFKGTDSFTVVVSGINKKTPGNSVLQIEVKARPQVQVSSSSTLQK